MTASTAAEAEPDAWKAFRELIGQRNSPGLERLVTSLEPAETVRAMLRLAAEEQEWLLQLLPPGLAADIIEDLPESHAADLIERLGIEQAADIVEELSSDFGADLLAELQTTDAEAILSEMAQESAGRVRHLIAYSSDVAGGLMGTEHYAYPETARVQDFVRDLEAKKDERGYLPQRVLLVDRERRLVGAVEIADILLADRETRLSELKQEAIPVSAQDGLDALEAYFDTHETLGAPVVDKHGRLVGRLRRRALYDELADRAQEDQMKTQGIVGGEELRTMSVFTRSRRRLSWLSINIFLNMIAASVIAYYQDTVSAVIALAVFLPIVSDMSGCSGNQAVAVSMRELTLGVIKPRDVLRVWWQEASVGLLNGIALGCLLALVAYLWQGSALLGAVVGVALCVNTLVAVSIGGTVPLLLKGWKADPAVASGPVLTTVTDMCGFFLVLGLATIALPWLS